jgi:glycosyltransferase involved in cell wall biosynthesis
MDVAARFGVTDFAAQVISTRRWTVHWLTLVLVTTTLAGLLVGMLAASAALALGFALWIVQAARTALRVARREPLTVAVAFAVLNMIGKWAQLQGQMRYLRDRRQGCGPALIEYKTHPTHSQPAPPRSPAKPPKCIVYLSSAFPQISETFVYREVRELRRRGWHIHAACLHTAPSTSDLSDVAEGTRAIYGRGRIAVLLEAFAEIATHPTRALSTLSRAFADALSPGEPLSLLGRAKLPMQACAGLSLARTMRYRGISHIHCHFAHSPTTIGMYAAHQLGITFSFTGHANDIFQRRTLLKRKLQRAAFVLAISHWHEYLYERIHPAATSRYHVVRCGVPIDAWHPMTQPMRKADQPLRILTVCRLVEKKGVDTLLQALHKFGQQTGTAWRLTVAGDGPERTRLEALTDALGCRRNVQWLGTVSNDRVRDLMTEADVFALACRHDHANDRDGIPVALMEAMACGLPVICGDLPAIRELVEPEQTGLLFDGNNPDALVACLKQLHGSPRISQYLANAGRRWVRQEFSLETNIDRLEAILQECLTGKAKEAHEPVAV